MIFCPTSREISLNRKVVAELHIPGAPNVFLLKGIAVAWQKAIPRNRIRGGLYLKFSTNELKRLAYYLSIFSGSIPVPPRRRKHPRLPVLLTARARIVKKPNYFEIKIHNFSEGGARISSEKKLEVNSIISIKISTPGGVKPIPFSARVVNNPEENLYGINFITREHGTSSLLKEIMKRFKKLSFIFFLFAFMIP
ncbi:MAG: PilZ domain-containing protein, partial [Myxococcota bacterium]